MELTQLQAHSLQFDTTPPSLPELPLPSASGPQLQISQPLTSGQPPDSSAAPSASAVLELSATGLVQLQADTQSTDPSSHTVSTNGSTTASTVPTMMTEATLTISASLSAPSASVPTALDAQQAVDEIADGIGI